MKIGAMVESFRAGLVGGLEAAVAVGAQGVQIYATSGEMHPDNMTAQRGATFANGFRTWGWSWRRCAATSADTGSRTPPRTSSGSRTPSG